MNNRLVDNGRVIAKKQFKIAILVTLIICISCFLFWGEMQMTSAFIGAMIAIIPNRIFAYKAFKYAGAQASNKVVESFYRGVKIKMVITAILFAIVFKFFFIMPIPFFLTYSLVMVLPLLTGILFKL